TRPTKNPLHFLAEAGGRTVGDIFADIPCLPPSGSTESSTTIIARGLGQIAFSSAGQIFVVGMDGSGLQPLTTPGNAEFPTWSPDGKRLAYASSGESADTIYVMD